MSPLMLDFNSTARMRKARTRPFATTPAKVQDIRRLVDIEFSAFEDEQVNQVLSFRDYKKPAHFERSVEIYRKAMNADISVSERLAQSAAPRVSFKKVVDTETGEVVSFAKVEMKTYTPDELSTPLDIGHEDEPRMNRDWFALNERLRREYIGPEQHCCTFLPNGRCYERHETDRLSIDIGMLATAPRHQHQGAGTMLLEEILTEADDAGIEVYLEATDTARPLYEKHGFEAITELRFDPGKYGLKGVGVERQTVMVRGALDRNGDRRPVISWEAAVARVKAQPRAINVRTGERSAHT